jgi:hypothetical protein
MKRLVNPLNTEQLWKKDKSLNSTRRDVYLLYKYYIDIEDKRMADFLFQVYLHLCDYRNLLLNLEEHIDKANPHGY